MSEKVELPKSDKVDIMLFAEGTYPYVKGGVSTWISQLINGLPEFTFGVCFIGSTRIVEGQPLKINFKFPKNLIHIQEHFMFEEEETPDIKKMSSNKEDLESLRTLHKVLKDKNSEGLPPDLQKLDFFLEKITYSKFLYSKSAWNFLNEEYENNCPDIPFIDYFWTLRNMHKPIWILAKMVSTLPEVNIFHAPSTGYAGFSAALASYNTNKPYILTEHGIYTRERKIDMLAADWIKFNKPQLLKEPEEYNYLKKMWIEFFSKLGVFCYKRANFVLSLFNGAKKIQIEYGANEKKCRVIPNGVDTEGLGETMKLRQDPPKPIITLIGRIVPIKDIKTFIRAVKIAVDQNPDIEAWAVGPIDEDMAYFQECQDLAITLGLKEKRQEFDGNMSVLSQQELIDHPDKVKFFGFSNIKEILPKSALQTLSSISEGMPLVILEGFAAGVPCVSTDVGSCKDLIYGGINDEDIALGKAGAVTNIADPEALAREYVKYLDFDNGEWEKAQKIALERVNKFYKQDMFLSDYKKIYDQALKAKTWDVFEKQVLEGEIE